MSEKRECRICGRTMQYHPCGGWFCDHLEPIIDARDARIAELVGLLEEVANFAARQEQLGNTPMRRVEEYDALLNRIRAALDHVADAGKGSGEEEVKT